jgi:4'-phosphopantetheinyl transferase
MEHHIISSASLDEGLRRFFWIWTLKEAYTKALGQGLGFDFTRIEYNVPENIVMIDGKAPRGWQFSRFEINVGSELYQGVAAEFTGGSDFKLEMVDGEGWLVCYDAVSFVQRAIQDLQ